MTVALTRILFTALILTMGVVADVTGELAGLWNLEEMQISGQIYKDPRWTVKLEFNSEGNFWLNSTTVQEIFLQGNDGTQTTRARQDEVSIQGTFALEKDCLRLVLKPPLAQPQLDFALHHFGPPSKDKSYLVKFQLQGSLKLDAGTSCLLFQRNKRHSRS